MIRRPPRSTLFPLHDALPISLPVGEAQASEERAGGVRVERTTVEYAETLLGTDVTAPRLGRSEEHTSELQSRQYPVCGLLLDKKSTIQTISADSHPPVWSRSW